MNLGVSFSTNPIPMTSTYSQCEKPSKLFEINGWTITFKNIRSWSKVKF